MYRLPHFPPTLCHPHTYTHISLRDGSDESGIGGSCFSELSGLVHDILHVPLNCKRLDRGILCKLLLFCIFIKNDGVEKLLGDVRRYADLEELVVPVCVCVCVWRGHNVWGEYGKEG